MRMSTDPQDPGHEAYLKGRPVRVFFDGAEIKGVMTADEEKRLIVAAVLDDKGGYQLDKSKQAVLTETRYGHVRIEPVEVQ